MGILKTGERDTGNTLTRSEIHSFEITIRREREKIRTEWNKIRLVPQFMEINFCEFLSQPATVLL